VVDRLSKETVVAAAQDQVGADLEQEAVILNLTSGVYYGLDPVGARIWAIIKEPRKIGDIHDMLCREYDVDPERCEQDLFALIEKLNAEKLIEIRHETAA